MTQNPATAYTLHEQALKTARLSIIQVIISIFLFIMVSSDGLMFISASELECLFTGLQAAAEGGFIQVADVIRSGDVQKVSELADPTEKVLN